MPENEERAAAAAEGTKIMACWCRGSEIPVLAVLVLTPALAGELLECREVVMNLGELKWKRNVACVEFANLECEFYNAITVADKPAAAFYDRVAAEHEEDDCDEDGGWFEVAGPAPPEGGEIRTDWAYLRIFSGGTITFQAQNHYTDDVHETDDFPLDLLRVMEFTPEPEAS
jgi:hypothetical protein